jgi:hypothetical protein
MNLKFHHFSCFSLKIPAGLNFARKLNENFGFLIENWKILNFFDGIASRTRERQEILAGNLVW